MLHVVHITKMCPLNYLLSINYHVAHEQQKPEVQLQVNAANQVKLRSSLLQGDYF